MMKLLKLNEPSTKKIPLRVYAEITLEIPSNININPYDIKLELNKGFVSGGHKLNKKKAVKFKPETKKKERRYEE